MIRFFYFLRSIHVLIHDRVGTHRTPHDMKLSEGHFIDQAVLSVEHLDLLVSILLGSSLCHVDVIASFQVACFVNVEFLNVQLEGIFV